MHTIDILKKTPFTRTHACRCIVITYITYIICLCAYARPCTVYVRTRVVWKYNNTRVWFSRARAHVILWAIFFFFFFETLDGFSGYYTHNTIDITAVSYCIILYVRRYIRTTRLVATWSMSSSRVMVCDKIRIIKKKKKKQSMKCVHTTTAYILCMCIVRSVISVRDGIAGHVWRAHRREHTARIGTHTHTRSRTYERTQT